MQRKEVFTEKSYYGLIILLMIFISFISYYLAPLIVIGDTIFPYIVTATLGFALGWFIAVFVRDINDMTSHHHSSIVIVVFIGSLLSFLAVQSSVAVETATTGVNTTIPLLTGAIFGIGFLIPYLLLLAYAKKK